MKKVLVAGATGYLGKFMVQELKKRNYWVRVLIRKESQKKIFENMGVDEFFIAEITIPSTIRGITSGIDYVFSSVGITRQKDGLTYMDVDYQANLNLLKEAEKDNVALFEYVSVFGADKLKGLKIIEAKERFVSALNNSPIRACVVRPTGFFVDLKEVLAMAKTKKVYLIGNGENRINPIEGSDLAKVCTDALEQKPAEVTAGGPKIYTQNQIVEIAFNALKVKGKVVHISKGIRNIILFLLRLFTSSKFYGPIEFFLTAVTIDSVAQPHGNYILEEFYVLEADKMNK